MHKPQSEMKIMFAGKPQQTLLCFDSWYSNFNHFNTISKILGPAVQWGIEILSNSCQRRNEKSLVKNEQTLTLALQSKSQAWIYRAK